MIIVATVLLFIGLGLVLGLVPQHGGGGGHGAALPTIIALSGAF